MNNTLSKEGRQKIINKNNKDKETDKIDEKKEVKYNHKDNDIIYDLCHNLIDIEDIKDLVI